MKFPGFSRSSNPGLTLANAFGVNSNCVTTGIRTASLPEIQTASLPDYGVGSGLFLGMVATVMVRFCLLRKSSKVNFKG